MKNCKSSVSDSLEYCSILTAVCDSRNSYARIITDRVVKGESPPEEWLEGYLFLTWAKNWLMK